MSTTNISGTGLLAFVPGDFTRHLASSVDEHAVCGALAVPQGDRRPVTVLRVDCAACLKAVTP